MQSVDKSEQKLVFENAPFLKILNYTVDGDSTELVGCMASHS